ncbi:STN domain-containing protein [Dyella acidisoli]|uniref:TonB-dependent outer membrane receptor n=1 Tax=Dyella acidisoli TaxID=1867834 RepID=A0ABQ5XIG0_9GAMM|nr:STN domain-containing protein [Dyella acidisoli]GLQ91469.1 TonB-dependent outer membrane receptor [Dyella acidisoli]
MTLPLASPAETASTPSQTASPTVGRTGLLRIDDSIAFDIPAQSLLTALQTYSELTGQAVLVDNALAEGRRSPGVHGNFDKTEALQKLLAGTGLVASYSSDQAFTLKLAESDASAGKTVRERPESVGVEESEAVIEHYAGQIQKPIEAALCQLDDTRPGTYRLAVQIWIASSGHVEKAKLLTPISGQRDYEVRHALNKLVLEPPPPGMPQPITMLLLPGHAGDVSVCATALPYVH